MMAQEMMFRTAVNGFHKAEVMTYIEKLMTEKKAQKEQIGLLEASLEENKAALAASRAAALTAVRDACADCEKAKSAQAQLGATMLDAKRFSELLLKDANDKAAAVLNEALAAVGTSAGTAGELAEEIKKVREDFNRTLGELYSEMSAVLLHFNDFAGNLEKNGYDFIYHTDFAAGKSEAGV